MGNRRTTNELAVQFCGAPASKTDGDYMPKIKDLFDLLKSLHYRAPLEVKKAREAVNQAKEARQAFERSNKTWRQLHRAEIKAERELRRIECVEREHWEDEIVECRDMLRLEGVTPAVKQRIQRLVYGDIEE